MKRIPQNKISIVSFLLIFMVHCAPSDDAVEKAATAAKKDEPADETTEVSDTAPAGTLAVETNPINITVPKHLAVSSPLEKQEAVAAGSIIIDTTLRLNTRNQRDTHLTESNGTDYYSKKQRVADTLTTKELATCTKAFPQNFGFPQGNFGHGSCFGPQVSFTNHPDTGDSGSIGNGDLGMFFDYGDVQASSGEACSARVANNLIENVANYADAATGLQAMVACAARIAEKELPSINKSIDLIDAVGAIDTQNLPFTLTTAEIVRQPDSSAGYPVYETTVTGLLKDEPRSLEKNFSLLVRHIPENAENTTYKGVVQFVVQDFEGSSDMGISILYTWANKLLNYRYRQALSPEGTTNHFDDQTLEVNATSPTEVTVNMDGQGFGALSFTWLTVDLLVFNAVTKSNGTGAAYFGHTPKETQAGTGNYAEIKGLRCLPINPPVDATNDFSQYVQRQTLQLNTSSGIWELQESNIRYAPTVSCAWNSTNDAGQNASFTVSKEIGGPGSNVDEPLSFPIETNLYSVSDYKSIWVGPIPPPAL